MPSRNTLCVHRCRELEGLWRLRSRFVQSFGGDLLYNLQPAIWRSSFRKEGFLLQDLRSGSVRKVGLRMRQLPDWIQVYQRHSGRVPERNGFVRRRQLGMQNMRRRKGHRRNFLHAVPPGTSIAAGRLVHGLYGREASVCTASHRPTEILAEPRILRHP